MTFAERYFQRANQPSGIQFRKPRPLAVEEPPPPPEDEEARFYNRISGVIRRGVGLAGAVTNVVAPRELQKVTAKLGPLAAAIPRQAEVELDFPEELDILPKGTRLAIGQPLRGGEGRGVLLRFPF